VPKPKSAVPIQYKYRMSRPALQMEFHSHPTYEIYYFHEGRCNYLIGDKIFVLQPGDLILMNGMTLHCPNVDSKYPYVRTTLHFEPSHVRGLMQPFQSFDVLQPFRELGNHRLHLKGEEREEVEALLERLDRLRNYGDPISQNRFQLAFLDLLQVIYRLCQQPLEAGPEFPSEKERHVQEMIAFVERNYHEDLHLEQLENRFHLSKYYLAKIFKDVTGVTLFKYIYQRRINQAKIMFLLDKRLTVTDVCFQVGFKHLAHFSRTFKEQVGCTPEQYRKTLLQASAEHTNDS